MVPCYPVPSTELTSSARSCCFPSASPCLRQLDLKCIHETPKTMVSSCLSYPFCILGSSSLAVNSVMLPSRRLLGGRAIGFPVALCAHFGSASTPLHQLWISQDFRLHCLGIVHLVSLPSCLLCHVLPFPSSSYLSREGVQFIPVERQLFFNDASNPTREENSSSQGASLRWCDGALPQRMSTVPRM